MNEKCFIITYELSSQTDINVLHNAIKSYGTWAKINETTWAIITNNSAVTIRDHLSQYLNLQDRIFVVKSGIEAAWRNVECSNEWLKRNL